MANLLGCANIEPRACDDCPIEEKQKIIHVAFVKRGVVINKSSSATIISSLLAAEAACNAYVIRNVSGEYDGGTLSEGAGPGKAISRILGGTHQIVFTDFNYVGNEAFWNTVKNAGQNFTIWYFTDTRGWEALKPLTIMPKPAFGRDNQLFIEADITVKWSSADNPISYLADVDDLETCASLFTFSAVLLESGSDGTVTGGSTITIDANDTLNAYINAGVAIDAVTVAEGTLPTGLAVSVSGTEVLITGTPTVAGTYEATLRISNACGVATEVTLTFVIA